MTIRLHVNKIVTNGSTMSEKLLVTLVVVEIYD